MTPTYFPYQIIGSDFLATRRRAMLADEPGLGKTAQAIRAANITGADPVLVIHPASVRSSWVRDIATFGVGQRFVLQSYDKVARDWEQYEGPWGAIILDEAHRLKSPSAKRTSAIYGAKNFRGLLPLAGHVWALTGTPAPNNPSELHTHMAALFPESLRMASNPNRIYDRDGFMHRYCQLRDTTFGLRVVGSKNLDDLRERLKPHLIRRLKKDVLTDLLDIQYEPLLIDAPEALAALSNIPGDEVALIREVLKDGDAAALSSLTAQMTSLRRITAIAKAPLVAEWVREFLADTDRKVVVFAHHREAIDILLKQLRHILGPDVRLPMITGGSKPDHRAEAIEKFQNDPKMRIFIGQIQAAGEGITLTSASDLIFLEQSWVPSENAQAAMRIHRIGQKRGCMVRYATLAGSVDEAVQRVLARKTQMLSGLFG